MNELDSIAENIPALSTSDVAREAMMAGLALFKRDPAKALMRRSAS